VKITILQIKIVHTLIFWTTYAVGLVIIILRAFGWHRS
jgi:hypothetical protein